MYQLLNRYVSTELILDLQIAIENLQKINVFYNNRISVIFFPLWFIFTDSNILPAFTDTETGLFLIFWLM